MQRSHHSHFIGGEGVRAGTEYNSTTLITSGLAITILVAAR